MVSNAVSMCFKRVMWMYHGPIISGSAYILSPIEPVNQSFHRVIADSSNISHYMDRKDDVGTLLS